MSAFDTGVWTIYIDDVDGELAMDRADGAKRQIEVCEHSVLLKALEKIKQLESALEPSRDEAQDPIISENAFSLMDHFISLKKKGITLKQSSAILRQTYWLVRLAEERVQELTKKQ